MMSRIRYSNFRREYSRGALHLEDLAESPFVQFLRWYEEAVEAREVEPNGCSLATSTKEGEPSVRMVLMKHFDEEGLIFFTNYQSRKASDLLSTRRAALCFFWPKLERQVCLEGKVEKTSDEINDLYFSERPRDSQLSVLASQQGAPIPNREFLKAQFSYYKKLFDNKPVPRPDYWGGFRIIPTHFEFWQGGAARLHDRFLYKLNDKQWDITRLAP